MRNGNRKLLESLHAQIDLWRDATTSSLCLNHGGQITMLEHWEHNAARRRAAHWIRHMRQEGFRKV